MANDRHQHIRCLLEATSRKNEEFELQLYQEFEFSHRNTISTTKPYTITRVQRMEDHLILPVELYISMYNETGFGDS